jgi:hypothetical protein
MSDFVEVKFPMAKEIWQKVVDENDEHIVEVDERSDQFIVTYSNKQQFEKAQTRWEGMVEHEVLK